MVWTRFWIPFYRPTQSPGEIGTLPIESALRPPFFECEMELNPYFQPWTAPVRTIGILLFTGFEPRDSNISGKWY